MVRAGLLALLLAAAAVACAGARAANPISTENSRPGTPSWQMPAATGPAIEGYTSETSATPGETIHFHVSTQPAERYRIQIYRLGWYGGNGARLLACLPSCTLGRRSAEQPVPPPDPSTGEVRAGWPVTDELTIPGDWVSGYYLAKLVLAGGDERSSAADVFFVVRAPASRESAVLVQVPVNTWQAYNPWGGKSLDDFNSSTGAANHVSFDRPLVPAYVQVFLWELQLVRFLEREGYDVSYQTDVDTHRNPAELEHHRLVVTAGHGEYWTKELRDAFEQARDLGTNLAFMGANTVEATSVLHGLVGPEWDAIPDDLPAPCFKDGLKVLFSGVQETAHAVRYVAQSGARVFSAGSLQFAWGLDSFGGPPDRPRADPRLRQFMRNALDDLTRPARPLAVSAVSSSDNVVVTVVPRQDPRVRTYVVLRRRGRKPFRPGEPGVTRVCQTSGRCVDRGLAPGPYRYEAFAVDLWCASSVAATGPVLVR